MLVSTSSFFGGFVIFFAFTYLLLKYLFNILLFTETSTGTGMHLLALTQIQKIKKIDHYLSLLLLFEINKYML